MCGPIQEQKDKKIEELKHDQIHETLTSLQSWDLADGQTLEERRQAHKESMIQSHLENVAMLNAAQGQLAQAKANAAAPGTPVQEQAPAKQTYKQRREQARKAKVARKNCPVGTADTYDCVEATSRVVQERLNALRSIPEVPKGVDPRVLGAFCQGYKVNKKGKPATPEDQAKADSDNAFFDAYISRDLERRKPYLEAFRKELMDFPLSADSASVAYMVKNAEMLKRITDRAGYYENIMDDPINKPYFDSLDPTDLELLSEKLNVMDKLGNYYNNRLGGMGVSTNGGVYYDYDRAPAIPAFKRMADVNQEKTIAAVAGWEQQKQEILERHMEQEAAAAKQEILADIEVDLEEQTELLPENLNFSSPAAGYATEELKRYRAMIEAHPDVYAANKPLITQLYQELYRGFDIFNDLALDSSAYQYVADARRTANGIQDPVFRLAEQKVESILKTQDAIRYRTNDFGDALRFYLQKAPLSAPARALLLKMGQNEATLSLMDRQHIVHGIFLGEDGMVAKSNQALRNARESGESPEEAHSKALQALGIRVSSTPAAMANNDLREDAFIQLPKEIAQKFHDIEGQGKDLESIQEDMKKAYLPKSQNGYVTGGGVDAVNEDLLALYGTYLNSDKSVQYLKFMCETLKDAEVFSGNSGEALAFLSQSLLNSFGANFTVVSNTQDSYQKGAAVRKVALESCRTLLSLPAMARLSEEERAKLPEATQKLANQYTALLNQVQKKIDPAAAEQ